MRPCFCAPFIAVLIVLLAHAHADDLFAMAPTDTTLNNDWLDEVTPFWGSDDSSLGLFDLAANPSVQDFGTTSDADPFSISENLFASDPMDLTALPACGTGGSLTSEALYARDGGSCTNPEGTIKLPLELFQDPVGFLRDKIRIPPVGQTNQPTNQGSEDDKVPPSAYTTDLKPDEEVCSPDKFGPANIPVCANPYTGYFSRRDRSLRFNLINALPCMCFILQFMHL